MNPNRATYRATPRRIPRRPPGFTLIEMLVVIGIIAVVMGLLLPSLGKARAQAQKVQCMANMEQIGEQMLIYAGSANGYLFPPNKGWPATPAVPDVIPDSTPPQYDVWPYYVFVPHVWNPKYMICPSDLDASGEHSYIANAHLLPLSMPSKTNSAANATSDLKYSSGLPAGHSPSDVIVLGEKITSVFDYYMDPGEFDTKVEQYRHGLNVGSNYLMLDMHVETMVPADAYGALDPWDPAGSSTTQPGS